MPKQLAPLFVIGFVCLIFAYPAYRWYVESRPSYKECISLANRSSELGPVDLDRCQEDGVYLGTLAGKARKIDIEKSRALKETMHREFTQLVSLAMSRVNDPSIFPVMTEIDFKNLPSNVRNFLSLGMDSSEMTASVTGGNVDGAKGPPLPLLTNIAVSGSIIMNTESEGEKESDKYGGLVYFEPYPTDMTTGGSHGEIRVRTDALDQYQRSLIAKHCGLGCNGTFYITILPEAGETWSTPQLIGAAITSSQFDETMDNASN